MIYGDYYYYSYFGDYYVFPAILDSDDNSPQLFLSFAQEDAQRLLHFWGQRRSSWSLRHVVEQRHDLLIQLAYHSIGPFAVNYGFLPSFGEGRRGDSQSPRSFCLREGQIIG